MVRDRRRRRHRDRQRRYFVHATGKPGVWLVRSVTNEDQWYATTLASCTCASHLNRGHCKHQTAVLVLLLADALPGGHRPPPPRFPPGNGPALAPIAHRLGMTACAGRCSPPCAPATGAACPATSAFDKLSLLLSREITSVHDLTDDEARHVIAALRTLGN